MNDVEESLRVINVQIGYYRKQIKLLEEARKEIEEKYKVGE